MVDFSRFNSIFALTAYFSTEKRCKQAIIEDRWENGDVVCPHCGSRRCARRTDGRFRCKDCRHNFSCLVGTIFENTNLPLIKWFIAMYLISSHKKGISSHQLARDIEVTQTTAWYMLQKVRRLYPQYGTDSFSGTVECDEVYIGGREKWKHKSMKTPNTQGRSTKTKTPVFGMMERGVHVDKHGVPHPMTYVHAFKVEKTDRETLHTLIGQFVEKGSRVITDELNSYNGLEEMGYTHGVVNHGAEEFAQGDIFTNSVEGFWSHFRRMITGCYHDVSDEHLQQYIDEACFRWNTRKMDESDRFAHMFQMSIGTVKRWKELRLCA